MKFTSDVVVLSARRYSMTDDKTGELVQVLRSSTSKIGIRSRSRISVACRYSPQISHMNFMIVLAMFRLCIRLTSSL